MSTTVKYGSGVNQGYPSCSSLMSKSDSYQTSRAFWDRNKVQSTATKAIRQATIAFLMCTAINAIPFAPAAIIIANPFGVASFVFVAKLIHTALMPVWVMIKALALTLFGYHINKAIDFLSSSSIINKMYKGVNFVFEAAITRVALTRLMPIFNRHNINVSTPLLSTALDSALKGSALLLSIEIVDWMLCKGYRLLCKMVNDQCERYNNEKPDQSFVSKAIKTINEKTSHARGFGISWNIFGTRATVAGGMAPTDDKGVHVGLGTVKDGDAHTHGKGNAAKLATEAAKATAK